jgi:hypothetical protein
MNKIEFLNQTKTNWTVSKRPLFDANNNSSGAYGIYRDDTNLCLGLAKDRYAIIQNSEVLDLLMEATSEVGIESQGGGIIDQGKKIYYQFPLSDVTIGASTTKRYITALSSHDGSSTIGFGATNVNVYCSNTFFRAMQELSRVKHTTSYKEKLKPIIENLKSSLIEEQTVIDNLTILSQTYITGNLDDDFLLKIIGGDSESTRTKNRLDLVKSAISIEENVHGHNYFSVFNGITRFTNHLFNYKDLDAKRKSIVYGTGYTINNNAYEELVENFIPKNNEVGLLSN